MQRSHPYLKTGNWPTFVAIGLRPDIPAETRSVSPLTVAAKIHLKEGRPVRLCFLL
jgi:hypothetical protein